MQVHSLFSFNPYSIFRARVLSVTHRTHHNSFQFCSSATAQLKFRQTYRPLHTTFDCKNCVFCREIYDCTTLPINVGSITYKRKPSLASQAMVFRLAVTNTFMKHQKIWNMYRRNGAYTTRWVTVSVEGVYIRSTGTVSVCFVRNQVQHVACF
jgi:hypothetical protein